jgi:translation initiation factor 2B subunit (eIF-2B alpha/beta/delta family)
LKEQLDELVVEMKAKRLTDQQLMRLNFRLSGAPIFQWGLIEQVLDRADKLNELSKKELDNLRQETDRLLHTTQKNQLSMVNLEFASQPVAVKDAKSGRLTLREEVSAKDIQEFLRRITAINEKAETPKTEFNRSPSQVFRAIVEEALSQPK